MVISVHCVDITDTKSFKTCYVIDGAVLNLEICQSGSYVSHDILNRVISKMVLVKL